MTKNFVIKEKTQYPYISNIDDSRVLDANLLSIIDIFKLNKIAYWLCHGTLLGVVRDKQLISWKNDIDIAIWDTAISKTKLVELMTSNNFELETDAFFDGDNILYFHKPGGRLIDIHFYQIKYIEEVNKNMAILYSVYVPKNIYTKFINVMSRSKNYNGKLKYLIRIFSIFENFFKFIKKKLIKNNMFYNSVCACEPLEFLKEFKEIDVFGNKLMIPNKSEELIKYMYGDKWKIPNKNYFYLPGQGLNEKRTNRPLTVIKPLKI